MKSIEISRFARSFSIGFGLSAILVAPFLRYYGLSWSFVFGLVSFAGLASYAAVERVRPPRGMEGPDDRIWFLLSSTLPVVIALTIQTGTWIVLRARSSGPEAEATIMFWTVVVVGVAFDLAWLACPLIMRRKSKQPNQALQTTSVAPAVFGKVSVSDRQRRGV